MSLSFFTLFTPLLILFTTGAVCVRVALRGGGAREGTRTAYDEGVGGKMTRGRNKGV